MGKDLAQTFFPTQSVIEMHGPTAGEHEHILDAMFDQQTRNEVCDPYLCHG